MVYETGFYPLWLTALLLIIRSLVVLALVVDRQEPEYLDRFFPKRVGGSPA
jgi:hypothetical protein